MGLKVPQLNSSCCGCTLRSGSIIILWLGLIFGLVCMTSPSIDAFYKNRKNEGNNSTANENEMNKIIDSDIWKTMFPSFGWMTVVIGASTTIASGFGLYGVYKENSIYVTPYLGWILFNLFFVLTANVIMNFTLVNVLSQVIVLVINLYFWLVVFSHYRVLKGSVRPTQA